MDNGANSSDHVITRDEDVATFHSIEGPVEGYSTSSIEGAEAVVASTQDLVTELRKIVTTFEEHTGHED